VDALVASLPARCESHKLQPEEEGSPWSVGPTKFGHEIPHRNAAWRVAYTSHPGRFEDQVVHHDLGELLKDSEGCSLQAALLTSFWPFEPTFLERFPRNIDLTVCLQDNMEGDNRKVPKHFFGIELRHVEVLEACGVVRAQSSHGTRCFHDCNPKTNQFLQPCRCPAESWGWHSKVMTRVYPPGFCKRSGCSRVHGWRYIGSHNTSRACWGWGMEQPKMGDGCGHCICASAHGEWGVWLGFGRGRALAFQSTQIVSHMPLAVEVHANANSRRELCWHGSLSNIACILSSLQLHQ